MHCGHVAVTDSTGLVRVGRGLADALPEGRLGVEELYAPVVVVRERRHVEAGHLAEVAAALDHIRANYGGKLSMIDHWFGKVMATLDAQNLWESTAVIVCTDVAVAVAVPSSAVTSIP